MCADLSKIQAIDKFEKSTNSKNQQIRIINKFVKERKSD